MKRNNVITLCYREENTLKTINITLNDLINGIKIIPTDIEFIYSFLKLKKKHLDNFFSNNVYSEIISYSYELESSYFLYKTI